MTNQILTLEQAFQGDNFEALEMALTELNLAGVFDVRFLPEAATLLNSKESLENLRSISTARIQ